MNEQEKRNLTQVLLVLSAAVLAAVFLVSYMLYHYNPSGHFIAGNTLLAPKVAQEMRYTNDSQAFIFDEVEFDYHNASGKGVQKKILMPVYEKFYDRISLDESIENLTDEIVHLFDENPAILRLYVKNLSTHSRKAFQEVQFSGNHYRILLPNRQSEWIYFMHPQILQEVNLLFL